jgi:hypothetical protein
MKVSYSFIENSPKRQSLSLKQDWFFTPAVLNSQVQHFFFFFGSFDTIGNQTKSNNILM